VKGFGNKYQNRHGAASKSNSINASVNSGLISDDSVNSLRLNIRFTG